MTTLHQHSVSDKTESRAFAILQGVVRHPIEVGQLAALGIDFPIVGVAQEPLGFIVIHRGMGVMDK